jgi:hypothetical protein
LGVDPRHLPGHRPVSHRWTRRGISRSEQPGNERPLPLLLKQPPRYGTSSFFRPIHIHQAPPTLLDDPLMHVFVRAYCVAVDLMAQVKCHRAVLKVSGVGFPRMLTPYLMTFSAG